MIDKKEFLSTYNMTDDDIAQANITWEELMLILEEYEKLEKHLRDIGKEFINDYLYDIEKAGVHSYRYRTKSPGHLVEKIIRKRKEDPEKFLSLNHTNYYKYMTDLIGIRVFYLYREDWTHFHHYITNVFENNPENYIQKRLADFDENPDHYYIAERPKVYKRPGDTKIYDDRELMTESTVPFTILSNTKAIMLKSREEHYSKKDGVKSTMTSYILTIKRTTI